MSKLNKARETSTEVLYNHNGAKADKVTAVQQLERLVMSCLLWENSFYIDGVSIANSIRKAVAGVKPAEAAAIAIKARTEAKLRHVPLLIVREMARLDKFKPYVKEALAEIIQRPDEITEFLAIYWADNKEQPISAQIKKGLAAAFDKFNEYSFAKYNRKAEITLADVMNLVHPKPNKGKKKLYTAIIKGTLKPPDTWEVALSGGGDKKEVFTRLLEENKLGALALLRNLRNMLEAGVKDELVADALNKIDVSKLFPFQIISAQENAKAYTKQLEGVFDKMVKELPRLEGKTAILVDVSGSMDHLIAEKSQRTRLQAACSLALLAKHVCEDADIYSFSDSTIKINTKAKYFGLIRKIEDSQPHRGTDLKGAVEAVYNTGEYSRIIVFSDEQADDPIRTKLSGIRAYMVNLASYQNGLGYKGDWLHIDGFSDKVLHYIQKYEEKYLEKVVSEKVKRQASGK